MRGLIDTRDALLAVLIERLLKATVQLFITHRNALHVWTETARDVMFCRRCTLSEI